MTQTSCYNAHTSSQQTPVFVNVIAVVTRCPGSVVWGWDSRNRGGQGQAHVRGRHGLRGCIGHLAAGQWRGTGLVGRYWSRGQSCTIFHFDGLVLSCYGVVVGRGEVRVVRTPVVVRTDNDGARDLPRWEAGLVDEVGGSLGKPLRTQATLYANHPGSVQEGKCSLKS